MGLGTSCSCSYHKHFLLNEEKSSEKTYCGRQSNGPQRGPRPHPRKLYIRYLMQMELRWLVRCLERREITLGYLGRPGVITRVPESSSQNRHCRVAAAGELDPVLLDLKMEEGSQEPRNMRGF